MDIRANRIVYLGYGKYWRSDQIVGLVPIEDERGPGRRTMVYVATLDQPIVASRTEEAIRREMTEATEAEFRTEELRATAMELLEDLVELSPVLKRMLRNEGGFDAQRWEERLSTLFSPAETRIAPGQEDLFGQAH